MLCKYLYIKCKCYVNNCQNAANLSFAFWNFLDFFLNKFNLRLVESMVHNSHIWRTSYNLKSKTVILPALFFFLKIVLAVGDLLCFHIPVAFITVALQFSQNFRSMIPPGFFFFFLGIILPICSLLSFHAKFRIVFSIIVKNAFDIFMGIMLTLQMVLCHIAV